MRYRLSKYFWMIGAVLVLPLAVLAVVSFTVFNYTGSLFGSVTGPATITEAFGINDGGKIVGGFCANADTGATIPGGCSAPGNAPSHGYVRYKNGSFRAINFPDAFETETTGINEDDTIVGLYDPVAPNPPNADKGNGFVCYWPCDDSDDFHTIIYPGAVSTDNQGINEHGDIVGVFATTAIAPIDHGFLRNSRGKFCSIDIPGGTDANALGINEEDDVVGSYDDTALAKVRAFLVKEVEVPAYVAGNPQPCKWESLVTFEFTGAALISQTEAAGINNEGVIVGNYLVDGTQVSHSFLRKPNGTMVNIDPPTLNDSAASGLNNKGVIVGNLTTNAGDERAYIRRKKTEDDD